MAGAWLCPRPWRCISECHHPKVSLSSSYLVKPSEIAVFVGQDEALNMCLLYDSAIPLLGVYVKEVKAFVHTKTCT